MHPDWSLKFVVGAPATPIFTSVTSEKSREHDMMVNGVAVTSVWSSVSVVMFKYVGTRLIKILTSKTSTRRL